MNFILKNYINQYQNIFSKKPTRLINLFAPKIIGSNFV